MELPEHQGMKALNPLNIPIGHDDGDEELGSGGEWREEGLLFDLSQSVQMLILNQWKGSLRKSRAWKAVCALGKRSQGKLQEVVDSAPLELLRLLLQEGTSWT